ncbi:MAG: SDR family oxidoreductase [Bacteroidaceae bacterium]|nr:SDR family oxidoreductase [Bacteroidaceae bacterium]
MKNVKVILVTGASSGFGKAMAEELVGRGHIVYGTSRKGADIGNGVRMLPMDVTDNDSVVAAVRAVIAGSGRIDVLINNAGVGIGGALELATEKDIEWQMNTNFMGVVNVCRAVLPHMRERGSGLIINISSIAGVMAVPFQGFYSASKFAIEGYSEALSLEVHPFGIKVCVVEPGDFCTNFTANRAVSDKTMESADYGACFRRTMAIIEREEKNGSRPQKLARTICRLVERRNPPFRTKVGPWFQVVLAKLRWMIPQRLLAKGLRWFYGIG